MLDTLLQFAQNIEGPYKWYVIWGFVAIVSAVLTKIALKTIKWFVIVVCVGVIIAAIVRYFS